MINKKRFAYAAAIVLVFAFAGLIWFDVGSNQRINSLEASVNGLSASANTLGNQIGALENMTWHSDGNYTLSPSETSVTFNTEGKAWRMTYTYNGQGTTSTTIEYNLLVLDANGNIVGGLDGIELTSLKNSGTGTIFVPEGQGTYSVEIEGVFGSYTFTFLVQSYY